MPRITHTTLSGRHYDLTPSDAVAAFLQRLRASVTDPRTKHGELVGMAYSMENPILDLNVIPGRGAVTTTVMSDPAYAVMVDLLFRKEAAEHCYDLDAIDARYSMTTEQAAKVAGVETSAIVDAIAARRLACRIKDGMPFIDPRSLASPLALLSPR